MEASASALVEPVAGCGVTGPGDRSRAKPWHGSERQTPEQLAAWVAGSCADQSVPVKITDALVVSQVAALLGRRDPSPPARERGRARTRRSSEPPNDLDAVGVQSLGAGRSGTNGDVIDDCCDEGDALVEIQSGPAFAQGLTVAEADDGLCVGGVG